MQKELLKVNTHTHTHTEGEREFQQRRLRNGSKTEGKLGGYYSSKENNIKKMLQGKWLLASNAVEAFHKNVKIMSLTVLTRVREHNPF